MKKTITKIVALAIAVLFVLPAVPFSSDAAAEDSLFYILPEDNENLNFSVGSYEKSSSESYMFLPNTVDPENVVVKYDGSYTSITGDAVTEWNDVEKLRERKW